MGPTTSTVETKKRIVHEKAIADTRATSKCTRLCIVRLRMNGVCEIQEEIGSERIFREAKKLVESEVQRRSTMKKGRTLYS
jgi:hypothetical protein